MRVVNQSLLSMRADLQFYLSIDGFFCSSDSKKLHKRAIQQS